MTQIGQINTDLIKTAVLDEVWAYPGSNAAGSGSPLLLLGRVTGLWGIRSDPSRGGSVLDQ